MRVSQLGIRDIVVSILALPEGRALSCHANVGLIMHVFQSSPFPKEGRYGTTSPRPKNTEFGPAFREPTADCSRLTGKHISDFIQVIEK